jgi:hypothetical protein
MRQLTTREQRTLRIGGTAILIYLLLFSGFQVARFFSQTRSQYVHLLAEAQSLKEQVRVYEDRTVVIKKLMEGFQMDPSRLSRTTVVAQASAAIQRAAMSGGVMVGSVRESPGQASRKELAIMQLEAMGPVPGLLRFLHQLDSVGFPILIDSLQIGSDAPRPGGPPGGPPGSPPGLGPIKMSLVIVILDFDQWKKQEVPRASA